ncbi:MAG: O-antigen ligase family protein [Candidatus Berkelbacteria bacterium]
MLKKIATILAYLAIALIPFYVFRFDIVGIRTNLLEVVIALAFAFVAIDTIFTERKFKFGSYWPYVFLLLSVLATTFAYDNEKAVGILKGWFLVPAMYYLVVLNLFRSKEKIAKLLSFLAVPTLLLSVWAILQHFGIVTKLFYQVGNADLDQYLTAPIRAFGPFDSPNSLAMFLAPAICLLLIPINSIEKQIWKILSFLSLAIPLFALYFTASRASFLAVLFAVFIFALIGYIKTKKAAFLTLSVVFLLGVGLGLFFSVSTNNAGRAASNTVRAKIYHYSIELAGQNWLKGVGLGGYPAAIDKFTVNDVEFHTYNLSYAIHPHNIFLAMWLNLGLFGLLCFIALLVDFMRAATKRLKSDQWRVATFVLMAMSTIIIHGLFDTTYFKNDLSVIFWLIFGLIFLINSNDKNDKKN